MAEHGSLGRYFGRGSRCQSPIESYQILPKPPGDTDALVPREKVREYFPQLICSIQNGRALTGLEFSANVDQKLFFLDLASGVKGRTDRIRYQVAPMIHMPFFALRLLNNLYVESGRKNGQGNAPPNVVHPRT
jgi:hypothetical protein